MSFYCYITSSNECEYFREREITEIAKNEVKFQLQFFKICVRLEKVIKREREKRQSRKYISLSILRFEAFDRIAHLTRRPYKDLKCLAQCLSDANAT